MGGCDAAGDGGVPRRARVCSARRMRTAAQLNVQVLKVFGPLLILTGILGFVTPPQLALMSGATPYNVFHLVAGGIGTVIAFRGTSRAAAVFNLVFGAIDLWQLAASLLGVFPAQTFQLRPADDVLHAVIGFGLVLLGIAGLKTSPAARGSRA